MRKSDWSLLETVVGAMTAVAGWALVIATTVVVGFFCGYWIGHGEFMGFVVTLQAMTWLPVVWLGQPLIFIPYAVTALAFYLPIRFELLWLHFVAIITTFLTWLVIVSIIVHNSLHGKFWHW